MSKAHDAARRPGRAAKRRRTPSGDVEGALVDAAETVLVRQGPGMVTVRTVAAEAGVAPMGIYNRLGGKDGLIEALLVRGFDRLRTAVTELPETDPVDRLRASGLAYRRFALANPQFYAVMFTDVLPHDLDSEHVAEHGAAAFGALVVHVQGAIEAGSLVLGDPFEIAQQLWSAIHGAVALELGGLIQPADPEAAYRALLDTLLRGLAA